MRFFICLNFFSLSLVKKLVHYHHYYYKFSFTLHEPMLSHSVTPYYNVMYTFFWWAVLSSWRQTLNLNVVFFWFKQVFSFIVWCDVSNCNTRRGWKSIQENLLSNFHNTWNQMVRLIFFFIYLLVLKIVMVSLLPHFMLSSDLQMLLICQRIWEKRVKSDKLNGVFRVNPVKAIEIVFIVVNKQNKQIIVFIINYNLN